MKELLVVENLSIDYGEGEKLSNLNFSISEKTLNAILCPNNCGKTSLIKTLSGINSQFEGRISVNGTVLSKKEFKKYILNVGVVTEDIDLMFITDIVRDELEFPMINLFYPKEEINSRIKKISKIVKIENILEKNIEELSLVEKIKVLIATSIMHIPKILLLDDIFRLLVESEKKEILKILNKIVKDLEMAVVFTTSDINNVISLNNIIVIKDKTNFIEGDFNTVIKEDNELSKAGFYIPIMIDLSRKLEFYNLVDKIYYDVDKVVDNLWK